MLDKMLALPFDAVEDGVQICKSLIEQSSLDDSDKADCSHMLDRLGRYHTLVSEQIYNNLTDLLITVSNDDSEVGDDLCENVRRLAQTIYNKQ
jgi:hypothetical protein